MVDSDDCNCVLTWSLSGIIFLIFMGPLFDPAAVKRSVRPGRPVLMLLSPFLDESMPEMEEVDAPPGCNPIF